MSVIEPNLNGIPSITEPTFLIPEKKKTTITKSAWVCERVYYRIYTICRNNNKQQQFDTHSFWCICNILMAIFKPKDRIWMREHIRWWKKQNKTSTHNNKNDVRKNVYVMCARWANSENSSKLVEKMMAGGCRKQQKQWQQL